MTPYKHLLFTNCYNIPDLTPWNRTGNWVDWVKGDPSKTNAVAYANGGSKIIVDATFSSETIPSDALVQVRFAALGFPNEVYSDWVTLDYEYQDSGRNFFSAIDVTALETFLDIYETLQPDFIEQMELEWEFKVNGGTKILEADGASSNPFYVTRTTPITGIRYHTVIHTGCKAAAKQTTVANVFNKIWDKFKGDNICLYSVIMENGVVNDAKKGRELYYYGIEDPARPGVSLAETKTYHTLEQLLQHKDGRCTSWAEFLAITAQSQGINALAIEVSLDASGVTWNGISGKYIALHAGKGKGKHHGVEPMANGWPAHNIVKYDGSYYDPSYGEKYNTELDVVSAFYFEYHYYGQPLPNEIVAGSAMNQQDKEKMLKFP